MYGLPSSNNRKVLLLWFAALLLLSSLGLTLHPVVGQEVDLSWTFSYNPLVSGANNSVEINVLDTALAPVRLLSLTVRFSWMQAGTYLSSGMPEAGTNLGPGAQAQYMIPIQVPADTVTGRYDMETTLAYAAFQTNQYGGAESITYVQDVVVLGRSSSLSLTLDPFDGRFYAAVGVFTLLGWYLPKRLLHRSKG